MDTLARLGFDSVRGTLINGFSVLALYGVWRAIYRVCLVPWLSPLRNIPGPEKTSFFWGNMQQIFKADPGELHGQWVKQYGHTLAYTGILGRRRLMTLDPKALSYVLNHSTQWQKPEEVRNSLAELLGKGVLFEEGEVHKRQRRIMNPSFAISHLRELTSIFHEKSQQLRNIWQKKLTEEGGAITTDVVSWLGQATLDIIGLAGFDYEFNALNAEGQNNELNLAFKTVTRQGQRFSMFQIAQAFFPLLKLIPTKQSRSIANATAVMDRLGRQLINKKKQAILAEAAARGKSEAGVGKNLVTTRDLLSRLMVANMANDLPESQKLSDDDVLAQIPTFLLAGHETTATATTWCLYALSRGQEIQRKLREELLRLDTDNPSMDEINSLPYLDAVIKETMRLHSAVPSTVRVATQDDVIPLSKPFTDKKGHLRHEIVVKKGDRMFIPIICANQNVDVWGEDALEFKPERWLNLTDKVNDIPGVVPGILSFIAGPRSCIGYRFALVESKCLIFALVRAFEFELAVDPSQIIKKSTIVTRPIIVTEMEKGPQLPLKITPYRGA
ncbi:hypothetical protein M422DRAFT_264483 [Sphaerobolus stellatus SS14]|uniref:Cytochrome P450 n=1 Tax=Sphaerobolus stellatus (strain SS14) TaxID=990650 RepID=A0A0C9V8C1_SPHS4|nr:hypothetical protein M422DRAFT_264483 [Sphaerobolus stellatus SS14]